MIKNKKAFFLACSIIYASSSYANTSVEEVRKNDNSRVNERDSKERELSADQQKSNSSDTQITARIRRDIMNQKAFSTYAKNIKIITVDGKVTLKGPVRTQKEQAWILQSARSVVGLSNVVDKIEIAPETY